MALEQIIAHAISVHGSGLDFRATASIPIVSKRIVPHPKEHSDRVVTFMRAQAASIGKRLA